MDGSYQTDKMETKKTVDEIVQEIKLSGENITVYIHNTCVELKRFKEKRNSAIRYRFYSNEEAKKDNEYIDFWTEVAAKLANGSPTLCRIYNLPIMKQKKNQNDQDQYVQLF